MQGAFNLFLPVLAQERLDGEQQIFLPFVHPPGLPQKGGRRFRRRGRLRGKDGRGRRSSGRFRHRRRLLRRRKPQSPRQRPQQLLAVRISNYDGFTEPFDVPTPPLSDSQTRQTDEVPYATVDLRSERVGYDRVLVRGAQVFPGTQTLQRMTLIPTPTLPDSYTQTQEFDIPPQTL